MILLIIAIIGGSGFSHIGGLPLAAQWVLIVVYCQALGCIVVFVYFDTNEGGVAVLCCLKKIPPEQISHGGTGIVFDYRNTNLNLTK
jgi:uncharacterized membrane protein